MNLPIALLLATHDLRADVDDLDREERLDGGLDLDLVRLERDLEEDLRLELLFRKVPTGAPPCSLSRVPFSVRSGRLMM